MIDDTVDEKGHRIYRITHRVAVGYVTALIVFVIGFILTFGWAILSLSNTQDKLADEQVKGKERDAQITRLVQENRDQARERSIKNCEIQNGFSMGVRGFLVGLGTLTPDANHPLTQAQADGFNKLLDNNFPVRDCPKLNDQGEAPLIPTPLATTPTTAPH